MTSAGVLVIALLIGHIFHATVNRIAKVEDDYLKMMELKKRAEAADVAKSQVVANLRYQKSFPKCTMAVVVICFGYCSFLLQFPMRSEPR